MPPHRNKAPWHKKNALDPNGSVEIFFESRFRPADNATLRAKSRKGIILSRE
jgi:hypothetical protein